MKLRALAAFSAVASAALAIYGYVDGETLLECAVLTGLAIFMAFIAINGPLKPKRN